MAAEIIVEKNCMTARLLGDLDHHSCALIRSRIDSNLEAFTPALLILDFSGVSFMDSSGIGLILGRQRIQSSYGGRLVIKNANEYVKKIVALAGLSGYIIDGKSKIQK